MAKEPEKVKVVPVKEEAAPPTVHHEQHEDDLFSEFQSGTVPEEIPAGHGPANDVDLMNFDEHHPALPQPAAQHDPHPLHALYNQAQQQQHHILQHHNGPHSQHPAYGHYPGYSHPYHPQMAHFAQPVSHLPYHQPLYMAPHPHPAYKF